MPDNLPVASQCAPLIQPENMRAEQALLGAILANNKAFDAVCHILMPEHFFDPINGRIFAAIAIRIEAGRLADAVSLKADFENAGTLDEVGGTAYLTKLLVAMVGILNAREYGLAVRDAWHRRQLIEVGETLVNDAFGAGEGRSATMVHETAEASLYGLGERGEMDEARAPAHEAMAQAIDGAVKASERPAGLVGLTTGFSSLDEITGGWRPGDLVLLAARPSMGKTTLALGMAAGAAAVWREGAVRINGNEP
jgi:replicative DNA helicase